MINQDSDTWFLPETISPDALIKKLAKKVQVQIGLQPKKTVTYYDTFDWRLYRKKYLFDRTKHTWHLIQYDTGERIAIFKDADPSPRLFAHSFSNDPLKSIMKETLGGRRLLPLVTFDVQSQRVRILNADQKTVAHIEIATRTGPVNGEFFNTVTLRGVRGYAAIPKKIMGSLRRWGIVDPVPPLFFFTHGVEIQGRSPGDYTAKFSIELDPAISTRLAAVAIFRQLLTTMRKNEEGIAKDIDPEFLHDFRVAMRRTRSGLSQMQGALPPKITKKIQNELADLGKITGPTRDLDVYLLYVQGYMARLPGELREGMTVFFTDMSDRRRQEWEKMVKALKSSRYQRIIGDWQAYLDGDVTNDPSRHSQRPVAVYARKIIYRRFKRIIKKGCVIGPDSPDADLHRLRIQCKKLRYSLEFFTSLFPAGGVAEGIRQLKRLQSHLGDFNDISVQQNMLQAYLAAVKPGSKRNLKLTAAIGGLLTVHSQEKRGIRKRFTTVFGEFSRSKNRNLFSKLFN